MEEHQLPAEVKDWMGSIGCAVTLCDKEGMIIYMNDRARETHRKRGNLIGHSLYNCHGERSAGIIRRLLATGETNTYTVTKHGIQKLIFQSPWRRDGEIAGLVEISIPLPEDMPHYDRDKEG
ncbi:MAG: PAS domain-containing protein [Bacteroidales bacterium]|nr:PAS domain-containing protein [Bacteroidales bacterium]